MEADAKQVLEKCGKEANASEQEITDLHAFKIPTSQEGKCTIACFYKHYSFLTENGVFDPEGFNTFLTVVETLDAELYSKLKQIVKNCENSGKYVL